MTAIRREDGFDFLSDEFSDLYDRSAATLFQHPLWLHHLYGTLAPAVGAEPVVITGRDPSDRTLLFVLPLVRTRGRLVRRVEFADLGVSDYAAPVIDRSRGDEVFTDAVGAAIRAAIGRTDLIKVDKVPDDPSAVVRLLGARDTRRHTYETHLITLGTSVEAWREGLDPKFVRHLDKKRYRVGRNHRVLSMRELTAPEEIDAAFARMREFRQARWADRRAVDLMQDPHYFDFYRTVARDSAGRGGPARTSVLTVNDETVAVSFGLVDDERDVFLLIGYDVEQYRNYSLGLIMVDELIALSIESGRSYYDLTLGHGAYKTDFGATAAAMHSARAPLTTRGRIARIAADREVAARQLAKRAIAFRDERLAGRRPKDLLRRK